MYAPFLAFFTFPLQVGSFACCTDRHICIICQRMPCTVFILDTVQTSRKKILGRHINCFFIRAGTSVCIDLSVVDHPAVLVVCHTKYSHLCLFHVIRGCIDKGIQLPVIQSEELCRSTFCCFFCWKTFFDSVQDLQFLMHVSFGSCHPNQSLDLVIDILELSAELLPVGSPVLFQSF